MYSEIDGFTSSWTWQLILGFVLINVCFTLPDCFTSYLCRFFHSAFSLDQICVWIQDKARFNIPFQLFDLHFQFWIGIFIIKSQLIHGIAFLPWFEEMNLGLAQAAEIYVSKAPKTQWFTACVNSVSQLGFNNRLTHSCHRYKRVWK